LEGPVDALLVEREELQLLGFLGEDASGDEGRIDLGTSGQAWPAF
jgi:hypothetical protein